MTQQCSWIVYCPVIVVLILTTYRIIIFVATFRGNMLPPSSGWPQLDYVGAEVNGMEERNVLVIVEDRKVSGQSEVRSVETPPRLPWQRGNAIAMTRETFYSCSQARVFCPVRESCLCTAHGHCHICQIHQPWERGLRLTTKHEVRGEDSVVRNKHSNSS